MYKIGLKLLAVYLLTPWFLACAPTQYTSGIVTKELSEQQIRYHLGAPMNPAAQVSWASAGGEATTHQDGRVETTLWLTTHPVKSKTGWCRAAKSQFRFVGSSLKDGDCDEVGFCLHTITPYVSRAPDGNRPCPALTPGVGYVSLTRDLVDQELTFLFAMFDYLKSTGWKNPDLVPPMPVRFDPRTVDVFEEFSATGHLAHQRLFLIGIQRDSRTEQIGYQLHAVGPDGHRINTTLFFENDGSLRLMGTSSHPQCPFVDENDNSQPAAEPCIDDSTRHEF